MMYETLKHYILKAWSLGLSGEEAIHYVCENAGVRAEDVIDTIEQLSMEITN